MLEIDGNYLEGGGQIVRTALALSTITGKSFKASDIRKGRKVSGLKAQHVHCVKSLEKLSNASSKMAIIGSEHLEFTPGKIKAQTLSVDIGTAGSISLLLQSLILPCFFSDAPVRLKITGGTSGKWATPIDFLKNILAPQIKKFCKSLDIKIEKRGYYPKGGGKVDIKIKPLEDKTSFPQFNSTEQEILIKIDGISTASKFLEKSEVAERQAKAAKSLLSKYNVPVNIHTEYAETFSSGSNITLWATFSKDKDDINVNNPIILGADALGERGKTSEAVGTEAANNLIKEIESKAPIDSHTADNLIPFMAIFGGKIKVSKITRHTKTNIWLCEQFIDQKFEIDEKNNIINLQK